MTTADHPLPSVRDAREWQRQAQTIAHAAVRLARDMALDYGKKLILHPKPAVELRYEGNPYRIGGGIDNPRREPPALFYARTLAQEAIQLERLIGRRIAQAWNALPAEEQAKLQAQNGGRLLRLSPAGADPWPAAATTDD